MIDDKMPVFVCRRCGNIIRAVAYEEYDIYDCRICGFAMTKTSAWLNEHEYNDIFSDSSKAYEFRKGIYENYVEGNDCFDSAMNRKRLDEELSNFKHWMYG